VKQFATFERVMSGPEEVEDWEIFNAPRPLPGHRTWSGEFLRGCFYSAVDTSEEDSPELLKQIEDQDGWRVWWPAEHFFMEWVERKIKEHGYKGEVDAHIISQLRLSFLNEEWGKEADLP